MISQLRLARYVRPHWRGLLVVLATMALGVGIDLLQPWPMKLLVDQVLGQQPLAPSLQRIIAVLPGPQGNPGVLLWLSIATVLIFLAATLLSMANTMAAVALGQRMTYDLGADLLRHLQGLSLLFHSRRSLGDTISRVTGDAYCVQTLVIGALVPLLQAVVMLMAMFFVMWRLSPSMTLLSLAVVPFLALSIAVFAKPMKRRNRERRDLEGRMMAVVQQTLSAVPVVQAFAQEEAEYDRFRSYADRTVSAYQRGTLASMWFRFYVGLVIAIGTAAIMWFGAKQVLGGTMTVGTVLVFLAYLASLYAPLNSITATASIWQGAAANADRVIEIFNAVPAVQDAPDAVDLALRGNVSYEGVTFGYEGDRAVIHGVSFSARRGEVVAIVGPTGAGKTTLVNLLIRFFDPWSGRVLVDGEDLRHVRLASLRHQVAMVLQEPFIFPLTVADNIAYGRPGASREDVVSAAAAASADEFIRRLPEGYDTIVGERGATLSGGEKQRLSIARAFLKNAPILILDEPTSALDARTETQFLTALRGLMKGRTTFVIAHRLSTIRNADQILVIDHGRIVEQGQHSELVESGGLYALLYRQQMEFVSHEMAGAEDT
jgi:ATP-binding cassette subfamily B protein/subfamily B ATP-binding cassette protein MsbA